jgi:dihydrolipoamide dehydrogenase
VSVRIVVIGAGPGGYVAALRGAQLGAQVTLIEKESVGGTCLHWGCIPSKIMKTSAELLLQLGQAEEFGIQLGGAATLDMARLQSRKARIVQTQAKGIEALLQHHGVALIRGTAHIPGSGMVEVATDDGGRQFVAWDRLIVAVGTVPTPLPGIPFDGQAIISSNEAVNLSTVPSSIAIVGGGVIGCEFACILAAMGSQVTVVEALERLLPLPSVDEDCSKVLLREFKKRKIKVLLGHTVRSAEQTQDKITIKAVPVGDGGGEQVLNADKMLVCIGRLPTSGLGLSKVGALRDRRGWVVADDQLRTTAPDVFAIGDILGPEKIMLAHVASVEGIAAAENAMGAQRSLRYDAVPSAIFTIPEVATVGLSEAQAKERGIEVGRATVLFRVIGKAQVMGELAGEAKIVYENCSGRVLGVHLIGPHAADLIAEAALAVTHGLTVSQVADTIHAHPTLAEIMGEAAMKAAGRALHG